MPYVESQTSLLPYTTKPAANESWIAPSGLRLDRIAVTKPVYKSYVDLYNAAALLVYQLEHVLDHPAHKALMRMGHERGLPMPDEAPVREQIQILKDNLNGYGPEEVCWDGQDSFNRDALRLPANTVMGFNATATETAKLLTMAFKNAYQFHYRYCFAVMKAQDHPYEGPKSIDEIATAWRALIRNNLVREQQPPKQGQLPSNWLARLG